MIFISLFAVHENVLIFTDLQPSGPGPVHWEKTSIQGLNCPYIVRWLITVNTELIVQQYVCDQFQNVK
jgi:hypothetical protein